MLDHGILNTPLAKRGNIDAQIDRYKADQARTKRAEDKIKAAETREQRAKAKVLVEAASDDRIVALYQTTDATPKRLRKKMMSSAHWEPELVIRLLSA